MYIYKIKKRVSRNKQAQLKWKKNSLYIYLYSIWIIEFGVEVYIKKGAFIYSLNKKRRIFSG